MSGELRVSNGKTATLMSPLSRIACPQCMRGTRIFPSNYGRMSDCVPTLVPSSAQTLALWVGLVGMIRLLISERDGERWDLVVAPHSWLVEYRGSVVHQFLSLRQFEQSHTGIRLANELWAAVARAMKS